MNSITGGSIDTNHRQQRSKGDMYEGVAFTFCKAATLALLFQLLAGSKYILPAVALGTALLYVLTVLNGRYTTRCILGPPWVIITFWSVVAGAALWFGVRGGELPSLLGAIGR
jgi:hypothetical protein